jgi:hypothetical protein
VTLKGADLEGDNNSRPCAPAFTTTALREVGHAARCATRALTGAAALVVAPLATRWERIIVAILAVCVCAGELASEDVVSSEGRVSADESWGELSMRG